jgi:hypothetical protein
LKPTEALLIVAAARKEARAAVADMLPNAIGESDRKSLADMAVTIKGDKGDAGRDGIDGKDGRDGIDGRDGKDGVNGLNGRDGIDGKDGKDGKTGPKGKDGRDGKDGKDGQDGADGVGVESATITKKGDLVIGLTDGKEITAGKVIQQVFVGGGGGSVSGGGSGSGLPPGGTEGQVLTITDSGPNWADLPISFGIDGGNAYTPRGI